MKAQESHRVPLSAPALALVETLKEQKLPGSLVFPAPREKVVSDMVLTAFLRRIEAKTTRRGASRRHAVSGPAFQIGRANTVTRATSQSVPWRTVSNKVETAYHRADLLEQRRPMMESWASHVHSVV